VGEKSTAADEQAAGTQERVDSYIKMGPALGEAAGQGGGADRMADSFIKMGPASGEAAGQGGGADRMADSFIKMGPALGEAPESTESGGQERAGRPEKWVPSLRSEPGQGGGGVLRPGDPIPEIDVTLKTDPGRGDRDQ